MGSCLTRQKLAPVITAASNGQDEFLKTLLTSEDRVKQKDLNEALCMATWYGHADCLEMLIEAGAEVNLVYQSYTLLETAARQGFVRCMQLLIQAGADLNIRGNEIGLDGKATDLKYTPLMSAVCSYSQEDAIQFLRTVLRKNVRVNDANDTGRNTITSILIYQLASLPYNKTILMLLLAAGEKIDATVITSCKISVPDYLLFEDLKLCLKHLCRETIRKHLLDVDPHEHLFGRVPASYFTDELLGVLNVHREVVVVTIGMKKKLKSLLLWLRKHSNFVKARTLRIVDML